MLATSASLGANGNSYSTTAGAGNPVDLFLVVQPGSPKAPACHQPGGLIQVRIEIGPSESSVVGGQFLVEYDPQCLDFESAAPGHTCDPQSPFDTQLFLSTDEVQGTVFYAVGVQPGTPSPQGPATMACLTFRKPGGCDACEACFGNQVPFQTLLVDRMGQSVPYQPHCSGAILSARPVVAECPANVETVAGCNELTALVLWSEPTISDSCDGPLAMHCNVVHSSGEELTGLIESGGQIPVGAAKFCCSAEGACGVESCCWVVVVEPGGQIECGDGDPCTADFCEPAHPQAEPDGCVNFFRYTPGADIAPPGGDGFVDVLDILCVLDGFVSLPSCPNADVAPCGGDDRITLDDILAVLDAFTLGDECPCPNSAG